MMASHRPAESSQEQPPPPLDPNFIAPTTAAPTSLPVSNFLVGFDWLLALGLLVLAFLVASFSVRNGDFWMHLASGRLLSEGHYTFGKDPFSYVGADRTWVNHSWLFDWVVYQLYKIGDGPALVIGKCVVLALTAGLLLLARRPGQSVFAGVACVGLALLAAAPRLHLQPVIATYLCLAVLMLLIVRMPKPAGSWRFPIAIAVLFALWANLDQWFFVGPVILLLYTIGHYLRPTEGEDAFPLWGALIAGILACMLNPHHYRIWELPPELADQGLAKIFLADAEFNSVFKHTYNSSGLVFNGGWDNPVNLWALIGLTVLGLVGFAVNYRRMSVGLAVIWAGIAALAVYHTRAIPFFALVSAPIAAINLAAAGRRLAERELSGQTIRTLHALRSGGRYLVGITGLILIAISYAGWLHPSNQQRRWGWELEPNLSMKRAAEQIHAWKQDGTLPPEARMLNFQPEFANYLAWYAPGEKSFFDYRLRFHRPEAAEYAGLRRYVVHTSPLKRREDPFDMPAFLSRHGVTYAVLSNPNRSQGLTAAFFLMSDDPNAQFTLWHVTGRTVILGYTRQTTIPRSAFARLEFDPIRAAFTNAEPLAAPAVRPPLPAQNVWDRYVSAPPVTPDEGEESFILMQYRSKIVGVVGARHQALLMGVFRIAFERLQTPALTLWTALPLQDPRLIPATMPAEVNAISLLAVRAARRAVINSPDHPDGYFCLAKAYGESTFFITADMQTLVTTVNLARCRVRVPDEPSELRSTINVIELCEDLAQAHMNANPRRLDLLVDVRRLQKSYLQVQVDDLDNKLDTYDGEDRTYRERELDHFRRRLTEVEKAIVELDKLLKNLADNYVNQAAAVASPVERAALARAYGLTREAIKELYRSHETFQKQLEAEGDKKKFTSTELAEHLAGHAELIELMMYDGRIEEALPILDSIDTADSTTLMASEGVQREFARVRFAAKAQMFPDPRMRPPSRFDTDPAAFYRSLRQAVSLGLGDLKAAAENQLTDIQQVRSGQEKFRKQYYPDGPPTQANQQKLMDDIVAQPLLSPLNVFRLLLNRQYFTFTQARINLHQRVAMTYLELGDVDSAAHHFRQVLDTPEFVERTPIQRGVEEYLKSFEKAAAPKGAAR
jgi:arsenate reductase-like glutaredoxin family protein